MGLRAYAVELVLDKKFARHRAGDVSQIRRGRSQHGFQRMEQPHFDILQFTGSGPNRGFTDVAAQHVGQRNISQ